MTRFNLKILTNYQSTIGEGPFFDNRNNTFYHVDVAEKRIHKVTLKDTSICSSDHLDDSNKSFQDCSLIRSIQQRQFSDLTTFIIPTEEDENIIIMNLGSNLVIYDFDNSKLIDNIHFDFLKKNETFTNGKCDSKNRLFIGTYLKVEPNGWTPKEGAFYRLDGRVLRKVVCELNFPNGMAWSEDSTRFYFIDSGDRVIYQSDFELEKGLVRNHKVLIDLKITPFLKSLSDNTERPDGCVIDQDDNLWIALWGGGRIVKFDTKTCKMLEQIETGFIYTSSVCFGKIFEQNVLFITSALSPKDLNPRNSGKSLIVQTKNLDLKPVNAKYFKFSTTR